MATIHVTTTTTATPEQFTAAVTDFGPGRSELFGNTDDSWLKVHDQVAPPASWAASASTASVSVKPIVWSSRVSWIRAAAAAG